MRFGSFIDTFKADNSNEPMQMQRKHSRRENDYCVAVIGDRTYPVFNWSVGGTMISGDERFFTVNDRTEVLMKFKIGDHIHEISQPARIIRKARGRIAMQFLPLTGSPSKEMQHVLNDCITNQYVESSQFA